VLGMSLAPSRKRSYASCLSHRALHRPHTILLIGFWLAL